MLFQNVFQPFHTAVMSLQLQPASDMQPCLSAVPPLYHMATAESKQSIKVPHSSAAKSGIPPTNGIPLNLFQLSGSSPSLQPLPLTTETLDEFKLGTWCSGAILNLEESPSEECDALREAYRSLGLGEDLEALQEQRDSLEAALQHAQVQLQVLAQENTQLKLQIRTEVEQGHPQEKVRHMGFGTLKCFIHLRLAVMRFYLPVCSDPTSNQ